MDAEHKGLWLGFLGVVLFALTTPMTRLAVGSAAAPELPPMFVTAGRAALAGLLSVAYLAVTHAPRPQRHHWAPLLVTASGVVIGFPLLLALALREVDAMHAAVVTGLLPLATAVIGAVVLRQRPSAGFWLCAVLGFALVMGFAVTAGGGLSFADLLLLGAVCTGAIGYVGGARLSTQWSAEHVICWVLVISMPLTWPVMWHTWPTQPISPAAWGAFAYVTVFSMWVGFFAWYRALAIGGTLRVSQVQLIQPFLSLLFAVPLLGERLDTTTLFFSLAVVATVFLGKKMPVNLSA